jgi:hypothetical protein
MPTVQEAIDRVYSDEALKSRLLADPKPVLKEFGLTIPDGVSVQIHVNTPTLINAVLPLKPAEAVALSAADPVSRIIEQAWQDPAFKAKLLSDPKEAAAESGLRLPEDVQLKVWENTPTVEHMILPVNPHNSELSDSDLEAVAGGSVANKIVQGVCGTATEHTSGMLNSAAGAASAVGNFATGGDKG